MITLAVHEENTIVAHAFLYELGQDCDKAIHYFGAHVWAQAGACKYLMTSFNCECEFSYSNQIFRDVFLTKGNSDLVIQIDILSNMSKVMTLEKPSSSSKENRHANDMLVNYMRYKELRMLRVTNLNYNTTHLSNIEQINQSLATIVGNVVITKMCLAAIIKNFVLPYKQYSE